MPARPPAVLRGLVTDWPAVQAADPVAYLVERANAVPAEMWAEAPEIEGRFGYTADSRGFNHDRKLATIAQLADLLVRQKGGERPSPSMPEACRSRSICRLARRGADAAAGGRTRHAGLALARQPHAHAGALGPPAEPRLRGRRPPPLHPVPDRSGREPLCRAPDFTLAGQPISLVDVDAPDLERFPRFTEALAHAETAVLGPGDALYPPSLWWHAVESPDEIGAMVNFWWRDGPDYMVTPLFTLLHAAYTMKDLPERERTAWRAMFDHYIFRDHGDPMAHLPEAGRGVLEETTAESVARLKATLARSLD